ncbi:unnamed protein product [Urochloa humidicola]
MAPPPPELMDELVGEILLRIPPDEPEHLFHTVLICKPWLRILTDPFRRCYRADVAMEVTRSYFIVHTHRCCFSEEIGCPW